MAGEESEDVRVRGIYATALTKLLHEEEYTVVDASPVIDRRFDAEFPDGEPAVDVWMTDDRQGVGVSGEPTTTAEVVASVAAVGMDTFTWEATAPKGAVFAGEVLRTNRGGAIVDLDGKREGFLPFSASEDYLDVGDTVLAQVHEAHPPWTDDRPVLGTEVRAFGGMATLIRGVDALVAGTPDGSPEHELARTTEMLSTAVPDGWGVRWEYAAEDADMAALDSALERAVERAATIETALEAVSVETAAAETVPVVAPNATSWVWFGRESRFALDERRRSVTATMPGHHRIKAGSEAASAAVDFVEILETETGEFPFDAVTSVFGPVVGDEVAIRHGKPEGRCLTLGRGTVTDRSVEKSRITVEREMTSSGEYDALGTPRVPGDVATTRFAEGRWWYPTVYRDEEGTHKGTYVNVATPVEIFPHAVRYVDLHVDVVKQPDGTVSIVDEDELDAARAAGSIPDPVAEKAQSVAERVADAFES